MSKSLGADNQNVIELATQHVPLTFSLGASLAIDTFFFQLGHETTRVLLRRREAKRKTIDFHFGDALSFFFIRYLRLSPLYMFVLFFYAYLVPLFGQGPVWYRTIKATEHCTSNGSWWRNLLYINNLYPESESCMPWAWYLAGNLFSA
jgi:peptidoglycan/LPS O-acetylase OafA/YrhL